MHVPFLRPSKRGSRFLCVYADPWPIGTWILRFLDGVVEVFHQVHEVARRRFIVRRLLQFGLENLLGLENSFQCRPGLTWIRALDPTRSDMDPGF